MRILPLLIIAIVMATVIGCAAAPESVDAGTPPAGDQAGQPTQEPADAPVDVPVEDQVMDESDDVDIGEVV